MFHGWIVASDPVHAFPLVIRATRSTLPHPRGGRYYSSIRFRVSLSPMFRLHSRLARRAFREPLSGFRLAALATLWQPSVLGIGHSSVRLNQSPLWHDGRAGRHSVGLSKIAGRSATSRRVQREMFKPPRRSGLSDLGYRTQVIGPLVIGPTGGTGGREGGT